MDVYQRNISRNIHCTSWPWIQCVCKRLLLHVRRLIIHSEGTIDYQARRHEIDFTFSPYYGTSNLEFTDAQKTLQLQYKKTILQLERNNTKTSGLDSLAVRPAQPGYPLTVDADPAMPIASIAEPHLSLDVEGIISNPDGTWEHVQVILACPSLIMDRLDFGSAMSMAHIYTAFQRTETLFKRYNLPMHSFHLMMRVIYNSRRRRRLHLDVPQIKACV